MASILKHLRSTTANKRPAASGLADGQIAINTASGTPAMFFKDNAGNIIKVGPAHVGTIAPNASAAGTAGNSTGEFWVDENFTTPGLKYYNGASFINLTPSGTTTTVGLVELATDAETQAGADTTRVVSPSSLQSKISDSVATTSSSTIASSTAVKSAYDLANAALPKAGGTFTGELLISPSGSLVFEGSSDDSFETTIAVTNPTADRTITFPNVTGNVVTTGDSGTVTSTMILDGTILNADINASAAIVDTKLDTIATADKVSLSALNIDGGTDIGSALENGDLFIVDDGAGGTNRKAQAFRMAQLTYSGVTGDITVASGGTAAIAAGVIVNADVNASAAIAGTKISPDFGSQNVVTTGTVTGASLSPTSSTVPSNGVYLPAANSVGISTGGSGRLFVDSAGLVGIGISSPGRNLEIAGTGTDVGLNITKNTVGTARFAYDTDGPYILDQNNKPFRIYTGGNERLRITSAGLVGIGTSSPSSDGPLTLANATETPTVFFSRPGAGSFSAAIQASGFGTLTFYNGAASSTVSGLTPRMTINGQTGSVGIGTTSPSESLTVGSGNLQVTSGQLALGSLGASNLPHSSN